MIKTIKQLTQDIENAVTNEEKARAYENRGITCFEKYQYENTVYDYTHAIKLFKNKNDIARAYSNRGFAHINLRQHQTAIDDFTHAIKLFKDKNDKATAYSNRGFAHIKLEQHQTAIDDFTHAIKLFKNKNDKANAYFIRGNEYAKLGQHKKAIDDYTKFINLSTDEQKRANIYFNRCIAYTELKRHDEAKDDFIKAIDLTCNHSLNFCQGEKKFYKFRPLNKNTLALLIQQKLYFSDITSLNDPLECPFVQEGNFFGIKIFVENEEYEPRILSLVLPCSEEESETLQLPKNLPVKNHMLLFSHYSVDHKGICIEYEISQEFLQKNTKIFYTPVQYQNTKRINDIKQLFAVKNIQWEYENEARFVAFGKNSKYFDTVKEGVKITKIFFGLKTSDEDKELVYRILNERGIQFFKPRKKDDSLLDFEFDRYDPPNGTSHTE